MEYKRADTVEELFEYSICPCCIFWSYFYRILIEKKEYIYIYTWYSSWSHNQSMDSTKHKTKSKTVLLWLFFILKSQRDFQQRGKNIWAIFFFCLHFVFCTHFPLFSVLQTLLHWVLVSMIYTCTKLAYTQFFFK